MALTMQLEGNSKCAYLVMLKSPVPPQCHTHSVKQSPQGQLLQRLCHSWQTFVFQIMQHVDCSHVVRCVCVCMCVCVSV